MMDSHYAGQARGAMPPAESEFSAGLRGDPNWELATRVASGPHFSRLPLLSRFLLFIVAETLLGRGSQITEHQIGVRVFDRPLDYRTIEDNIVRNYARQLRKRLAEHFAAEGKDEPVRIEVPLGCYVPAFRSVAEAGSSKDAESEDLGSEKASQRPTSTPSLQDEILDSGRGRRVKARLWLIGAAAVALYSGLLIGVTRYATHRAAAPHPAQGPANALWAALFTGPANSFIVPSDGGFNLLEDLAHQPVPLADYIAGSYHQLSLAGGDPHSAEDLRAQQLVPFLDLQIVSAISRLAAERSQRVMVRFPRDLRLEDLKNANAVILGSPGSNHWASLADEKANFRIVFRPGMNGAEIVNVNPRPGEQASYVSHWNEPTHETYALIAFLPNLNGNGHMLVLEGLDQAGTQAAAEMLLYPSQIDPILKEATRADGSLRPFEVLLRSNSIDANSTDTQVIASRVY